MVLDVRDEEGLSREELMTAYKDHCIREYGLSSKEAFTRSFDYFHWVHGWRLRPKFLNFNDIDDVFAKIPQEIYFNIIHKYLY